MYIYTYAYIYTHMYIHMCVYIYMYHLSLYLSLSIYIYIYIYVYVYNRCVFVVCYNLNSLRPLATSKAQTGHATPKNLDVGNSSRRRPAGGSFITHCDTYDILRFVI